MKTKLITALALTALTTSVSATSQLCTPTEYVVGFFNGVWNTEAQAYDGAMKLKEVVEQNNQKFNVNPETIAYEAFYNHTGSEQDASMFQDIAEVFMQRAAEISPAYSNNFELFWSGLSGGGDGFLNDAKDLLQNSETDPLVGQQIIDGLSSLYTDVSSAAAGSLSRVLSQPPTEDEYFRHSTRIKTLALEGRKLLMVAHSQGNLFLNHAYSEALSIDGYTKESIGVVHIAPASTYTNGPHILADKDLIINGLRIFGADTVPDVTVDIPLSHLLSDPSGHTLADTYLNKELETYNQVIESMSSELSRLVAPTEILASSGAFTATVTWNGAGDLDLHTLEPNGDHVAFFSRTGQTGYLDIDNVTANGPEHYFASCDPMQFQEGVYKIGLSNFARAEGRTATLQISTPKVADVFTQKIQVGPEGNQYNPDWYIEVNVAIDAQGNYSITAHDAQG